MHPVPCGAIKEFWKVCMAGMVKTAYLLAIVLFATILANAAPNGGQIIHHDLDTGIYSDAKRFVAARYMRHVWVTSDGVGAAAIQKGGYEGDFLVLYKTLDGGVTWTRESAVSDSTVTVVSDGIIDAENNLMFVTSFLRDFLTVDVEFVRFIYDPRTQSWLRDPAFPAPVFSSTADFEASRATLAQDGNGVLWCAFRLEDAQAGEYVIKVFYSTDGGGSWNDCGREFGTRNDLKDKSPKVIACGSRIALIYQDMEYEGANVERYKKWAARSDALGLQAPWSEGAIAKMISPDGDTFGSHWSVAGDGLGRLHLTYQDDNKINYTRYELGCGWTAIEPMANGTYSNISISPSNDLYLFQDQPYQGGYRMLARKYSPAADSWSGWYVISTKIYDGKLRPCSPETFRYHLPLLYHVHSTKPYMLVYNLLYLP
jgi:hypothetical protein